MPPTKIIDIRRKVNGQDKNWDLKRNIRKNNDNKNMSIRNEIFVKKRENTKGWNKGKMKGK